MKIQFILAFIIFVSCTSIKKNSFGEPMLFDSNSNENINLVINHWLSSEEHIINTLSYSQNFSNDLNSVTIAIAKSRVPNNFKPKVFLCKTRLYDDQRSSLLDSEVVLMICSYTKIDQSNYSIDFFITGNRVIGGLSVTYHITYENNKKIPKLIFAFDP